MANVTLTVGGRIYTVACAPGEEAHIKELARAIDAKVAGMGDMAGQAESRVLLFAAGPAPIDAALSQRLASVAGALENIADRLEARRDDA